MKKVPLQAWLLLALLLVPALAMADATSAQQSIMAYAWRIVNFIMGISAIWLIGDIAWHSRDMAEHGRRVKGAFGALVLLGVLYGVAAFILYSGDAQGTTVSGIDSAMSMKP